MNKVIIFTLDGCDHCVSLKKRLIEHSIPYDEIETTENEELWNKIVKEIQDEILPTTLILNPKTEESLVFVPGVHYQNEEEIIEIIKLHM
jgi:glutaredoxin